MCLITRQKEPLIAEEDITVYKILTGRRAAIYYYFKYEKDLLYVTVMQKALDIMPADSYVMATYHTSKDIISIGEGFHACTTIGRAEMLRGVGEYIFKATIPKGSLYYKDETDLIVSDKIIIHDKITE